MKIAIFGNNFQIEKNQQVLQLIKSLKDHGFDICIERKFCEFIKQNFNADITECEPFEGNDFETDLAISVGGDGTFLTTAACVGDKGCPILGFNTGRLGFLADVTPDVIDQALDNVVEGNYIVEQHTVLKACIKYNSELQYCYALNEVALLKHDNSSTIDIKTFVDGELLTNYTADGLVVCTPTGSTGYSLSAGGPILVPQSKSFCLTAVAPHSISIRPVVLSDDVEIMLEVKSRSGKFMLAVDGRSSSFSDKTRISLCKAPHTIGVMKVQHKFYFDTLREKLMWGGGRNN